MTPRNTTTGGVLEAMILLALDRGGYQYETQAVVGLRCGGGTHKVDAVARRAADVILVSLKWQQTGGTAEQRKNRTLLRSAMEAEGFTVYEYEWWHFDYRDWHSYAVQNVRFADIPASR